MNLYQLLSLDISPCLQKSIIQIYINHFKANDSIVKKKYKILTLNDLFKNDFIEITEYVLSISFIDIRVKLIDLLTIMMDNYFDNFLDFYESKRLKNFLQFIGENVCQTDLKINLESNLTKDDANDNKNSIITIIN